MTLWDRALQDHSHLREVLAELDEGVARFRKQQRDWVEGLPPVAVEDSYGPPAGIYGVGLWTVDHGTVNPAVFVAPGLALTGTSAPLVSTVAGRALLRSGALGEVPRGSVAVALAPPQPHAGAGAGDPVASGETVLLGARRASLGLAVADDGCPSGVTTAGHAVAGPGAWVSRESGERIGCVERWVDRRSGSFPRAADIALIRLQAPATTRGGRPGHVPERFDRVGVTAVRLHETVTVGSAGRLRSAWIRGVCPAFAVDGSHPAWGDVAITSRAISGQGDSGAVARREDGMAVGHVIGGYLPAYTLLQDLEYCLEELGVHVR